MLPLLADMHAAARTPIAAQPAAFRTTDECHSFTRLREFPDDLETIQISRSAFGEFGQAARRAGFGFVGGCCGCNPAYIRSLARGVRG
jgi:betaine-homocysteine S-methyltransferase